MIAITPITAMMATTIPTEIRSCAETIGSLEAVEGSGHRLREVDKAKMDMSNKVAQAVASPEKVIRLKTLNNSVMSVTKTPHIVAAMMKEKRQDRVALWAVKNMKRKQKTGSPTKLIKWFLAIPALTLPF